MSCLDSFHSFILRAGSLSLNLLSYFRFGQTWSETKTLQIVLESFCIHSHLPQLPLGRLFLFALPFLIEICFHSPWSQPFPPHAPTPIPLSLTKMWLPPHNLVLWTDGSVPSPLGKGSSSIYQLLSLWH